jgi:hypothetical protein
MTGDVGAAGITVPVDNCFADTLRKSDSFLALMGRAEARQGRLGVCLDALHIPTGYDDVRLGPATINTRSPLTVTEFGAAWQVADGGPAWALDAVGGGRWTRVGNSVRFANGFGGESTTNWVDPFMGLGLRGAITDRWVYTLRGDVGGFDVGSRIAWQAAATIARRDLLPALQRQEVTRVGERLAAEAGRTFVPVEDGQAVRGRLVGATQLASGRFAVIDDGLGFSLVPWRPILEKEIGREIAGIARGDDVSWQLGRKRTLGIGL